MDKITIAPLMIINSEIGLGEVAPTVIMLQDLLLCYYYHWVKKHKNTSLITNLIITIDYFEIDRFIEDLAKLYRSQPLSPQRGRPRH
jgi:hypothetical protein